ncbi:MAG: hypothetical protein RLZZ398_1204 [Verrucomicrobiota bacterium]|jgi:hypothetical protein
MSKLLLPQLTGTPPKARFLCSVIVEINLQLDYEFMRADREKGEAIRKEVQRPFPPAGNAGAEPVAGMKWVLGGRGFQLSEDARGGKVDAGYLEARAKE